MSLSDSALRATPDSRSDAGAPHTTIPRFDPRTHLLLEGPVVGTLLRLATPNVLVMFVQASVGLIETYFIAKLGTDALAGAALVFPVLMLMQMMSAGAMGGGISSAISRALGAGRLADADALVLHALAIAVTFGAVFMLAVLGGGRWLYGALGGRGASLAAALTYSNVVFSGAILIWLFNSLANVIRGTSNMAVPAAVTSVGAAALIPLSPCLIFGWGPLPGLGATSDAGLTEMIGLCATAMPRAWLSLFDTDPAMLDAGSRYLHAVGSCYGLFGLGMALYFASQGAGRRSGRCWRI
jgi:Na+-driven multidrug efflux pump